MYFLAEGWAKYEPIFCYWKANFSPKIQNECFSVGFSCNSRLFVTNWPPYCFRICVFLLHRQLSFMKRAVFQQWNTYFNWVIFKYLFFGALNFCFQGQELTLTLNSLHNFLSARLLILLVTLLQMSFPGFCSWKRWVETLSEERGGVTLTDVFIQIEQKSYFLWKLPSCLSVVLEPEQL